MLTLSNIEINELPLLSVVQLKQICRENAIKGFSKLKKIALIELVSNAILVAIARDLQDSIEACEKAARVADLEETNRPEVGVIKPYQATPYHTEYNPPRKAWFNIGETEQAYQGYTKEGCWNGWACPMFTREVAIIILEHICGMHDSYKYDKNTDTFFIYLDGALDEYEEYQGHQITVDGLTKTVYDIGAYGWVWDEVQLDNELEYNYFSSCEAIFFGEGGFEFDASDIFTVNREDVIK